jgi:hypothetical protein
MIALALVAVACALYSVVASILIVRYLQNRGVKINYLLIRLMIIKYLSQYREMTRQETGRVGPLFYHYVVPLLFALVLAIAIIVVTQV